MTPASRLVATAAVISTMLGAGLAAATKPASAQAPAAAPLTIQQCSAVQSAFMDYIRVNNAHFSNDDRAELRRFNAWLGNGCQGTITLARRPEVMAALDGTQTNLMGHSRPEYRVQLMGRVTFN